MEEECRAQNLHKWINITTHSGREALYRGFQHFTNKTSLIKARQAPVEIFRNADGELEELSDLFASISEVDKNLGSLRGGFSETEKDAYAQLFFTQPSLQILNWIPYFLTALAFCKCWIFPGMTILMPLLSLIIPFITMRYVYNIHISIETYLQILKSMVVGDSPMKTIINVVTFGASMAQNIIQPVQQSIHTQKTDEEMLIIATKIQTYIQNFYKIREITERLGIYCPSVAAELDLPDDPRQLFAYFYFNKHILFVIDCWLGDVEVAYRMAINPELCLADVYHQDVASPTFLEIRGLYDPSVPSHARVRNSIRFNSEKGHALLTGPNKGGKSTLLRSIALNSWLAQTFGVAFATSYKASAFSWIQTSLRLQDVPGQTSRFERECQGAQECLAKKGRGLILVDELFHSTNPPDGEKASERFLQKLWLRPHILSIISTHMFSLCEKVPSNVATLCCSAFEKDGLITYTYRVEDGICKLSSVEELLQKYSLV